MTETTAKKDVQKLQRAIVDGLEDVKAQDIVVFNTEHLSPLFERVMLASGTSNRQTKALAASVRDKVREAGFPKPRIEGEENGEWIIIDCGQAVVHVMQPAIRQYYHLEEIWGEKPVRLKLGAPKPMASASASKASLGQADGKSGKTPARSAAGKSAKAGGRSAGGSGSPSAPARKPAAKRPTSAAAPTRIGAKPAAKSGAKSGAAATSSGKRAASGTASRARKSPSA